MNEIIIATPWGGIISTDDGYDGVNDVRWSGLRIFRRIPGSVAKRGNLIFEDIYKYIPAERYRRAL